VFDLRELKSECPVKLTRNSVLVLLVKKMG
jgi:hypothetical protein